MRVFDIRPLDVEITTIFTLSELQHLKMILNGAIIRKDMYEEETVRVYENFLELIESLTKESEEN
jgi:hypothetical protein